MKVLVAYGSKRGGTAEIAAAIAETLRGRGFEVDCVAASGAAHVERYDALVIGGGLYARRWLRDARRFVVRNAAVLRARPVWMFSSGPLDDSASRHELDPAPSVLALMARIGARGHVTFGGRLAADARGFRRPRWQRPTRAIGETGSTFDRGPASSRTTSRNIRWQLARPSLGATGCSLPCV